MKTKMISKKFGTFVCKQCGKCCRDFNVLLVFRLEEWYKIIEFIDNKYEGKIKIMDDTDTYTTLTTKEIKKVVESYWKGESFEDYTELPKFWTLDSGKCPFLKKKDDKYLCEIQHIKPKVCKNYRCDLEIKDFEEYLKEIDSGECQIGVD